MHTDISMHMHARRAFKLRLTRCPPKHACDFFSEKSSKWILRILADEVPVTVVFNDKLHGAPVDYQSRRRYHQPQGEAILNLCVHDH